ncbi:unnamed protein product [Pleuronectes platessa]|uniref:Uncharacterized protein n=1 Tax=Pleuronectes platessa TaxID=8262 RepID=A0A9N7VLR5_PLEPL|nr:unnamed protein product [Pleuronectes platessa]
MKEAWSGGAAAALHPRSTVQTPRQGGTPPSPAATAGRTNGPEWILRRKLEPPWRRTLRGIYPQSPAASCQPGRWMSAEPAFPPVPREAVTLQNVHSPNPRERQV